MKLLILGFCLCVIVLVEDVSSVQQPHVVGGYSQISTDDDRVKELALSSLNTIAQQSGFTRSLGLVRIVSAKSQVVAGTNYKINLLVCEQDSSKDKNRVLDQQSCRTCEVTIWDRPWLNKNSVTDVVCSKPSELASFSNVANNN